MSCADPARPATIADCAEAGVEIEVWCRVGDCPGRARWRPDELLARWPSLRDMLAIEVVNIRRCPVCNRHTLDGRIIGPGGDAGMS